MKLDYQHVDSRVKVRDNGIWFSSFQDANIQLRGSDLPLISFVPPQLCTGTPAADCPTYFTGSHNSYADPYNTFYRSSMDHIENSTGNEDAARVDFERTFADSDWLKALRFGYRYANRDQTARFSTYNWGSLSEIWGGGGPVWLDDPVAGNGNQPMGGYETFHFNNFFGGQIPNPVGTDGRLFYARNTAQTMADYQAYVDYSKKIAADWSSSSWVPLAERAGVVPGTPFLPGEINPVLEKNNAAYVEMKFNRLLQNNWILSGNVGVRYTDTKRDASGYTQFQPATYPDESSCTNVPRRARILRPGVSCRCRCVTRPGRSPMGR